MSKIGGGAKDEESHIENMSDESDKASRAGRSRFQVRSAWMRPRSGTMACHYVRAVRVPARSHPRKRGPCSALRHAADFGHNPKGGGGAPPPHLGWREFCPRALSRGLRIFAILAAPRFAPRSKIVPAPHGFHSEMRSKQPNSSINRTAS